MIYNFYRYESKDAKVSPLPLYVVIVINIYYVFREFFRYRVYLSYSRSEERFSEGFSFAFYLLNLARIVLLYVSILAFADVSDWGMIDDFEKSESHFRMLMIAC